MTAVLVALALPAAGFAAGWTVCTRHHRALRVDRDMHEQAAHAKGDAAWTLTRQHERHMAAIRYLARQPQPKRVRIMSRWCRLIRQEMST